MSKFCEPSKRRNLNIGCVGGGQPLECYHDIQCESCPALIVNSLRNALTDTLSPSGAPHQLQSEFVKLMTKINDHKERRSRVKIEWVLNQWLRLGFLLLTSVLLTSVLLTEHRLSCN